MMRGKTAMATAVRDADGIIRVESKRIKAQSERPLFLRLPLIRGVVSFISSFTEGTKVLMRSADVYGEGEPSKTEKWLAEKLKINVMSVVTTLSVLVGLALAVFLFMWLPQTVRGLLERWFNDSNEFGLWERNFIEGGLKLLIFVLYVTLASLLKDIRRTFMYHGAEHKTIACYEKGLELTKENAKKCSRIHDRCGTTFMVFVMVISILVFAAVESLIGQSVEKLFRVLLKIALLPVVAGLSYELLKLLAKTKSPLVLPLKLPGMLLQCITTREPTEEMLEVAITAFKKVEAMDNDESISEEEFIVARKCKDVLETVSKKLLENGIDESAEAEWIVSIIAGCKRDEVRSEYLISPKYVEKINEVTEERCTGRPLWYCIGDTEFYGYKIKVDERALIPRPETELLAENAIECADENKRVLDLCTGSGAIAIAVNKEGGALVTAVDVSEEAITLAKENARLNGAQIEFVVSDLFSEIEGKKFDVIVSNPPYIKKQDISTLQREVKDFEPILALDGGEDGLDFYREISKKAKEFLTEGGALLLECGIGQAEDVKNMLEGYSSVEIIKDYEKVDRIVKAVL